MFTHESNLRVAHNSNCRVENEVLLTTTGSNFLRKSDNISEAVQDRDIVTTDH